MRFRTPLPCPRIDSATVTSNTKTTKKTMNDCFRMPILRAELTPHGGALEVSLKHTLNGD